MTSWIRRPPRWGVSAGEYVRSGSTRRSPKDGTLSEWFRNHPARAIAGAFAAADVAGTLLLSLPVATEEPGRASVLDALFTATSAVCVTGLTTVDTGGHWSTFGELVILALIQIGGLGIMTLATLVALIVVGRVGLRSRLVAQAETRAARAPDVRTTMRNVVLFSLAFESIAAVLLSIRFATAGGLPASTAAYHGVFHAVSAFNNAGFGLYPDNMVRYSGDVWVCSVLSAAVIAGGLGFPVVFELARRWRRPRSWSILTRVTLWTTAALLVVGAVACTAAEWSNPDTLGPLGVPQKLLAGSFTGVMPRTAGFNTLDVSAMTSETWLVTDILMFIGGGSAGTAGGIKVTTFALLGVMIWAEVRGNPAVEVGLRRVPASTQRQALSVALLGIGLVLTGTMAILAVSPYDLERVLFEATSAFATVGLTTGITAALPASAQLILIALMFAGRVGPLTVFSALAARERDRLTELPEENIPVG